MNTEQIKIFPGGGRLSPFYRRRRALYVSQPTLSRQIKALEAELGVPLLSGNNNAVELTEAGKLFYDGVVPLFRSYSELLDQVRRFSTGGTEAF